MSCIFGGYRSRLLLDAFWAGSFRYYSSRAAAVQPFLALNKVTPPVKCEPNQPPPTALEWLAKRGPKVPRNLIHRLFNERQVRRFDGQIVSRVKEKVVLNSGDRLLYPANILDDIAFKRALEEQAIENEDGKYMDGTIEGIVDPATGTIRLETTLAQKLEGLRRGGTLLTGSRIRRMILHTTPWAVFLNKPAGISAIGPFNSLQSVIPDTLKMTSKDDPKLVHRLDKQVSGVMVISRNNEAFRELSRSFANRTAQEIEDDFKDRGRPTRNCSYIVRTYWAMVVGELTPGDKGMIRQAVKVDGVMRPAITRFRVMGCRQGISWLELTPLTGRRHQMRIHCARVLNAPILGDTLYGYKGLLPTDVLFKNLPKYWWDQFGTPTLDAKAPAAEEDLEEADSEATDVPEDAASAAAGYSFPGNTSKSDTGDGVDGDVRTSKKKRYSSPYVTGPPPTGPIFLHSRKLICKKSGEAHSVCLIAPVPPYFKSLMQTLQWKGPPGDDVT